MAGRGLHEIVGWSFADPGLLDRLRLPAGHPLRAVVALENPLSEDLSRSCARRCSARCSTPPATTSRAAPRRSRSSSPAPSTAPRPAAGRTGPAPTSTTPSARCSAGPLTPRSWRGERVEADFFAAKALLEALLGALHVDWSSPRPSPSAGRSCTRAAARRSLAARRATASRSRSASSASCTRWSRAPGTCRAAPRSRSTSASSPPPPRRPSRFEPFGAYPALRQDLAVTLPDAVAAAAAARRRSRGAGGETLERRAASSTSTAGEQVGAGRRSLALALSLPLARGHADRRGRRAAARADRRGDRRAGRRAPWLSATTQPGAGAGAPRVIVAGATGFAGALAAQLLWRHPGFELAAVTGRSELGRPLAELYPRYRVPLDDRASSTPVALDRDRRGDRRLPARGRRAHRRGAARARRAGGRPERGLPPRLAGDLRALVRPAPAARAARARPSTGSPSCTASAIAGARHRRQPRLLPDRVACSALAPLARAGLIADVVIDAKQGISGAGRAFDEQTHLSMAGENILPYKVAAHRHTPEIEEQLALLTPASRPARAVPGLARAARPGRAGQLLRDARRAGRRRGAARPVRRRLRGRAVRRGRRRAAGHARGARDQLLPHLRRRRRAHRQGARLLRDRQPLEGHLLAGGPEPQRDVRPARGERAE